MATLTIRNIDAKLKGRLRIRAARHDRSMEEEVRVILRDAVAVQDDNEPDLASAIAALFKPLGGVELELPPREPMRAPPKFR